MQEIIVSRRLCFIQGKVAFKIEAPYLAIKSIFDHQSVKDHYRYVERCDASPLAYFWGEAVSNCLRTFFLWERFRIEKNTKLALLDTLHVSRSQKCTDDRDKVYAVLGRTDWSDVVSSNYELSVEEVYQDLAKAYVEQRQSLMVLSYCLHSELSAGLPSWVPDWRVADDILPVQSIASVDGQFDGK